MSSRYRYCPQCSLPLEPRTEGEMPRLACPDRKCGFIHWDNPVPVVAAVVEHEGRIVLARNVAWPESWYALVTGFLERAEDPAQAVIREVKEELNLDGQAANFIGHYEFRRMNQIIIAYHVPATGQIRLNEELVDYRHEAFDTVRYWEAGTGYALRDWLRAKGHDPQVVDWARGAG